MAARYHQRDDDHTLSPLQQFLVVIATVLYHGSSSRFARKDLAWAYPVSRSRVDAFFVVILSDRTASPPFPAAAAGPGQRVCYYYSDPRVRPGCTPLHAPPRASGWGAVEATLGCGAWGLLVAGAGGGGGHDVWGTRVEEARNPAGLPSPALHPTCLPVSQRCPALPCTLPASPALPCTLLASQHCSALPRPALPCTLSDCQRFKSPLIQDRHADSE